MRITYRYRESKDYWHDRWNSLPPDPAMSNINSYPLKHAINLVESNDGELLEAGCGAGRILRYFHERGYEIIGIDYIDIAIDKLSAVDPSLRVEVQDITKLDFPDFKFKYILAFGLYHNLEFGLQRAVEETFRALEPGGKVCASFRADNIQTKIVDAMTAIKQFFDRGKRTISAKRHFHKINLTKTELVALFQNIGFEIESIDPVENMPFLYKFSIFRSDEQREFNEANARNQGYRLSRLGQFFQSFLIRYFPDEFCNLYVLTAKRPGQH